MAFVLYVVEYIGIVSTGNDGRIGKSPGAIPEEFVHILGLDLVFPNTGSYKSKYAFEAFFGDRTSMSDEVDLNGVFHRAQPLQNGVALCPVVSRVLFLGPLDESILPGFGLYCLPIVFVGVEVDGVRLGHQFEEDLVEITQPVDRLYPANLEGAFLG